MNWGSVSEFLAMGGYAGYVWGSFGITAACLVLEILLLKARRREAVRRVG
jgi:heme exporter protein D